MARIVLSRHLAPNEFDVKVPLKIKDEIAPESFLYLKLANEVTEELERKR